ncbi:PREDICTED: polycomb group protein Psc-like isoform X2 [Dinoponera quadriceps]|uniref:Polycomb group protein Psc-like isoform X2 n=1 Tax=Dinoponera quadriceps TaxID=609295 RepID=A0A6P3WXS2_DINQU|nr:PREDICTED: polycomb group protein Psc-like isoform X2 [Dinoponera quadriceps]XP_014470717.1 PREDICTED: polycomb group protein Psc-like isoform X2 [Dinoponera quadriceps]
MRKQAVSEPTANSMEVAEREKPLVKDLNEHIMCPLCRGYLIDATTLAECLHSFCRGCIVRLSNGARVCPVCGVRTTPPLLPDTRLQRLVYLVVPGLFRAELQRRRHFLVLNPLCPPLPPPLGAINLTLDDLVSLSLEELDETEWEMCEDGVSRKRNDVPSAWNEDEDVDHEAPQSSGKTRYLKCPAAVTVRHLVRLLMLKRGWEETNSSVVNGISRIEILYHQLGPRSSGGDEIHLLSPFWTLLDLACIFHWKRLEPMRLVYRVLRKEETLSISEVPSKYGPKDGQPAAIENIPRPPTPPPSPKPSRKPEVEAPLTLESDTKLPQVDEAKNVDREKETKKPRCEVTPVMRTPDPPASLPTRNHHHHSRESSRSKDMGRMEHLKRRKRRKRRNKRVIAEITTTPREDLLKLKVRLTPCPPRITSSSSSSSRSEKSGRSKEKLLQLRAVRREKLKAITKQHAKTKHLPPADSPPLLDYFPVADSPVGCEETSAKDECTIEPEETIEDIIDSIPDEVVRIAQSEDNAVVERAFEPEAKAKQEAEEPEESKSESPERTKSATEESPVRARSATEESPERTKGTTESPPGGTKGATESPEATRKATDSPKKDEEILRRLGLVAVNEAIAELRDKAKQRCQHSAEKTNNLDREKLEKQLRESKANRVRSLLAEKQMRDALKSIMSKTNEELSSVNRTPSPVPAAAASTTVRAATPPAASPAAAPPAVAPVVTSAASSANNPALTSTLKKKGPPPLAPLSIGKSSGFAATSTVQLVSASSKYETPLDLSSGSGTVNDNALDLSATLTASSNPSPSSSSKSPTGPRALPVIISETIIRKARDSVEPRKGQESGLKTLSQVTVSGSGPSEKDQPKEPSALPSTAAVNKVALRIPQPHHRISGFRVKVIKPNLSVRHIPNPQAVVASQYRNQRPSYYNSVSQQPP